MLAGRLARVGFLWPSVRLVGSNAAHCFYYSFDVGGVARIVGFQDCFGVFSGEVGGVGESFRYFEDAFADGLEARAAGLPSQYIAALEDFASSGFDHGDSGEETEVQVEFVGGGDEFGGVAVDWAVGGSEVVFY